MIRELKRFGRDEYGGVVDTIVAMGVVLLVLGPALVVLSEEVNNLLSRIIMYLIRIP
jgi:hypothetical protein